MEPEEDVANELDFYSKFTRPLIFNLIDAKDRALASSWVKKIKDENSGTVKLRTDYLKLLLFALQRGHLVGVFADDPANYETLEEFPAECDLNDIAKKLIEKDQGNRQEKIKKQLRGEIGDHPPYITDCSSDFREYVAAQDIPNFGVHCYYAISKEPVNTWQRSERGVFPKLARSAVDTTSPLPPGPEGADKSAPCVCPPEEGEEESACKTRMDETLAGGAEEKKKKRGKKWGQTPPTKPLGVIPPADERPPPTWGTNLLDVRESAVDLEEEEEVTGVGMVEDLSAVEQFVEDFRRGALGTSKRAESTALQKSIEAATAGVEEDAEKADEEEEEDEAAAQRAQELEEDSHLVEYFKGQLAQAMTKQNVSKDKEAATFASPAKAGVPVTTPKQSPIPKRPAKPDESINADDLDDDELADLGLTREEAKELFRTDVFKVSLDEDSDEVDEGGDDTLDEELERDAIDDEFDAWCERIKELEKECEEDIRYLRDQGIDVDAIDAFDISAAEEGAGPCDPVCPAKSPSPQKPPSPKPKQPSPPKAKSPEKKPKGASMIKKPGTIKPPAAKGVTSLSKPSESRLQKPQVSKLKKPGELKAPSEFKLQPPSARPSKLQPPTAGRIPQPKRPCPPIQKGSPQAAAVITDYEKMAQLQIPEEPGFDLPQAEGADLIEEQQMPAEFGEIDFVPASPTDLRFTELDQYAQLADSLMLDVCEPCAYESPPQSPGARSPPATDRYGLPTPISLPRPKTPSPVRPSRQPTPQRAPSPQRARSPQRLPVSPERYPSPLKSTQASPPQRIASPCGALSPDIVEMAGHMSAGRQGPCDIFGGSPDLPASPEAYEPESPGANIFSQIGGESLDLDTSPPCIVNQYTTPPQSPVMTPMQRDMADVGYSIGTPQAQMTPLSPKYADYKSPPICVPKTEKKKAQEKEEKFIQFLFADDQDLHDTVQRAAALVADVEQEEPDPYHLMPASPPPFPFDQLPDDGGILGETYPTEYGPISPPSPICAQGGAVCPGTAQKGRTSTPIPRTGIPRPGAAAPSPRTPLERQMPSMTCDAPCPKGRPGSGILTQTPTIKPGTTPPCWGSEPQVPGKKQFKSMIIPQPGMKRTLPQPQFRPPQLGGRYQVQGDRPSGAPCGGAPQAAGRAAPRGSGIRPPAAGRGPPQQPSLPPSYYPHQPIDMEPQYPPINIGFRESVKKHEIPDDFFNRQRPSMASRCVVTGKTSGRRKVMQRVSDPKVRPPKPPMDLPLDFPKGMYAIKERSDESPLSPVQYGVPGIQIPPRQQAVQGPCPGKAIGGGRPSGIKPPSGIRPPSMLRPPGAGAPSKLRPPGAGAPSMLRPPGAGAPSMLRPPGAGAPSMLRPPGAGAPSKLRPPGAGAPSMLRPPGAGAPSMLRPPGAGAPCGAKSPATEANLSELAEKLVGILGEYVAMKSREDSRFEEFEKSMMSGPCTPCGPPAAEVAGRQVGKGFKPGPGKKVQYPRQVPGTPPQPTPIPWYEVETPSPTFEPPPRSQSPPREYSGFLASPQAGPSCRPETFQQYSPPGYDSPGEGLMEEAPPCFLGDAPADIYIAGPKGPSPKKAAATSPCQGIGSTPIISRLPGAPKQRKASRISSNIGRRKLDFEILTPKETDIADQYIADLEEQYDDSLPPLPPDQVPCVPCSADVRVSPWRTPPEIEGMVPKRRTPSPKPLPPASTHSHFGHMPLPAVPINCSVCTESPELADSPRTPTGTTPTPPRRTPPSRSPPSFDYSPPFSPCLSPGPATTSRAEDIFSSAGVSPARLPTPSPPSPLSTRGEMEGMVANVKQATGKGGIGRRRLRFDSPGINRLTPLPPITEMSTKPGECRMGLPGVVQLDYGTLGTGVDEEECVCGPYVPPSRSPHEASLSEEEYDQDDYDQIYQDPGPMTEQERRQLEAVAPTSPLRPFQPGVLTSPPGCSPPFALPGTTPMLDQTTFDEDECFCEGELSQFDYTPPAQRWSQMMENSMRSNQGPGQQMSPFSSPEGSPCEGRTVSQTSSTKRFITGVPPP